MPLSDVLHQDAVQERLQRGLASGRLPHAYAFLGPAGVGKQMLAVGFAKLLLCRNPIEIEPPAEASNACSTWRDACGACEDCELFEAGNHADFHRVHRGLQKYHPDQSIRKRKATVLGIDVIRHFLIKDVALRPSRGRAKVFIVDEAERLNDAAQNAMLKTLEEPPEHSYIILLSTSSDSLLQTTNSRCQVLTFRRLPSEFIAALLLERTELSRDDARFIAEMSDGSASMALRGAAMGLHEFAPQVADAIRAAGRDAIGAGNVLQDLGKTLAKRVAKFGRDEEPEEGDDLEEAEASDEAGDGPEDEDNAAEKKKRGPDTNAHRDGQNLVFAIAATILRDVQRAANGLAPVALPERAPILSAGMSADSRSLRAAIKAVGAAQYEVERSLNAGLIFDSLGIALAGVCGPASAKSC